MAVIDDEVFKISDEDKKELSENKKTSIKLTEEPEEEFHVNAVLKEPSKWEKFRKSMFSATIKDVGSYMLYDVLIPAFKSTFKDLVCNSLDVALYGEIKNRRSSSRSSDRGTYVSYDGYYDTRDNRRQTGRNTSSKNIENVSFRSRGEAMKVLDHMIDLADEYDYCSVAKFNSMCGIHGDYTDTDFGWSSRELRHAVVSVDTNGDAYIQISAAKPIR